MTVTEAQLDSALAKSLISDRDFARWFLAQTRFSGEQATCVFCRSDNPWGRVQFQWGDPVDGELVDLSRDCETDVLAVFETTNQRRLAVHIENKLAGGSFTPYQPELYQARLQQWKHRPKLGSYDDATSVLVAPLEFFKRWKAKAELFEGFISHEDLARHLPEFGASFGTSR